jgi:hypothetical protein
LGQTPSKRRQGKDPQISQLKWQQYDRDNYDLKDNEGLVEMNIAHSTFPPNFLVMTLKQSNPTTTKSLKLSKKVKTNVFIFMLHNTIHPSMTSPTRLQECLLPLTKSTHSRSLKRTQPISQATHPIHSPCPLKNNDG